MLSWEGSLIDPVGGILGAVVFHAVVASTRRGLGYQLGQFLLGICVGLAGGIAGVGLLWFLLRKLRLGELLGTSAQLASVVAVAAGCDVIRDDSGLIAAIVMGLAVANLHGFDGARLPSHGVVSPYTGGETLFDSQLTRYELGRRYAGATPAVPGYARSPPTGRGRPTTTCCSWSGRTAGSLPSPGPGRPNRRRETRWSCPDRRLRSDRDHLSRVMPHLPGAPTIAS